MRPTEYYKNILARTTDWKEGKSVAAFGGDDPASYFASCVEAVTPLGGRMIDVGCQAGDLIARVGHRFDSCCGVDLGDYSEYWQHIPNAEFIVHDVDSGPIPYPTGEFRIVTCFMVLEHVFDVFGLVEELARLTADGGYTILEVPNAGYFKHILSLIRGRVPRTAAQSIPFTREEGWDGQHLHYFTLKELAWLCGQNGLRMIRHSTRGKCKALRRLWPSLLYSSITLTMKKQA